MISARTIAIPRLVQVRRGCLAELPALIQREFGSRRVRVGTGGPASGAHGRRLAERMRDSGLEVAHDRGLDGRADQAEDLAARADDADLFIGVGGGRVIDTVKLAAALRGAEFLSVPTCISHDGLSSPVASLVAADGVRSSLAAATPAGVVIDLELVAAAPPRTLRAGVGDLLSNLVALLDWELAAERGEEPHDAYSAMIAEGAAAPVLGLARLDDPESHDAVAKGLLLSGLAMTAAGSSRPCSGAEHLISHSLDRLLGQRAALHGEQVALGSLFAAAAHDSPLLETLRAAFDRLGLPLRPVDLGISLEEFEEAVRRAPSMRPGRFTVLTELVASGGDRIPKLTRRTFGADEALATRPADRYLSRRA